METATKSRRGFATLTSEQRRKIASRGGKAAHALGKAHQFTSSEAAAAGKISHQRGTAHHYTRAEAILAGRKGGMARAAQLKQKNLAINTPPLV